MFGLIRPPWWALLMGVEERFLPLLVLVFLVSIRLEVVIEVEE